MSQKLIDTEIGGEQTQYESAHTSTQPHKKSGGQFSEPQTTTDPDQTSEAREQLRERGERTAENVRYGQTISEGGVSGFTTNQNGEATQEGSGGGGGGEEGKGEAEKSRRVAGYKGEGEQSREVGG